MRQIGTIQNERDATRFGAFLLTSGIDNTIEPSADSWAVWIASDDHLDKAREELGKFEAAPTDARYDQALGTARALQATAEKEAEQRRKNFVDVRTRMGQPGRYNTPLTFALIGISIVVYLLSLKPGNSEGGGVAEVFWFNSTHVVSREQGDIRVADGEMAAIRRGEFWRLVTPIFLHFGILHILFNMFWLRDFGGMIESRKGAIFLAIFIIVTAVFSNVGQYLYTRNPFFGGMSGVVYGLFGYVWIKGITDPISGMGLRQETVTIMLVSLVACMTGFLGPIANAAHVVGLLVGVVFAYTPYVFRRLLK